MKKRRSKFVLEVETGIILFATLHSLILLCFHSKKFSCENKKFFLSYLFRVLKTSVPLTGGLMLWKEEAVKSHWMQLLANLCGVNFKWKENDNERDEEVSAYNSLKKSKIEEQLRLSKTPVKHSSQHSLEMRSWNFHIPLLILVRKPLLFPAIAFSEWTSRQRESNS